MHHVDLIMVIFRLDVPAEFLDTEGDHKAFVDISDPINPTKKRFLSRYRNQSGIAARVPKGKTYLRPGIRSIVSKHDKDIGNDEY